MKALWIAQYAIAWIEDHDVKWPRISHMRILKALEGIPDDDLPQDLELAGICFARWFIEFYTAPSLSTWMNQHMHREPAPRPSWLPE